jgi:hypothetical protein
VSKEEDKVKHGNRLHRVWAVIKRQLKIAKSIGNTKYINQPHRLAKHHAGDCGQPHCTLCGNPRHNKSVKGKDRLTTQEKRNTQKAKDE